jgi:hypothetical protein
MRSAPGLHDSKVAMTMRRKLAVVPGLLTLAAAAIVLSAYSGASTPQGRQPDQPIPFPHQVHVQTLQMNCLYCHFSASKSPDPGMPAVSTCMGCHRVVGPQRPAMPATPTSPAREAFRSAGLDTLNAYAQRNHPIPWNRVHKVPDYVQFPHMRHVSAGVTCQTCHGPIQEMRTPVYQAESLNMGWCVRCHVEGYSPADGARAAGIANPPPEIANAPRKFARYDCAVCHY